MPSATGNLVRDTILYDAIRQIGGGVSFASAVAALPPDFDLDDGEYNSAIKILNMAPLGDAPMIEAEPKLLSVSEGTIAPKSVPKRMGDAPIEPPLTHEQANDAVLQADNNLGEARLDYRRAQETTKAARAAMANAVTVWQTGLPVYSSEQNVRDHLKAQQAARRERIEQGGPSATTPPGRSHIDRAAKYSRDNSPEGAARSRMQNGASRGAFSRSEVAARGFKNLDPRRGAVFKLPSEV